MLYVRLEGPLEGILAPSHATPAEHFLGKTNPDFKQMTNCIQYRELRFS